MASKRGGFAHPGEEKAVPRAPAGGRDPEETKKKLIHATLTVLSESGFAALGVNRVARQAGVDKVLIYRYFDGLDGLVKATAASANFWCSYEELVPDIDALRALSPGAAAALVLKRFARGLQRRPLALEILAWETVARTEHTAAFEGVREALAIRLGRLMGELFGQAKVDVPAVLALLGGGINYLCVRRRSIRVFNEVEIGTEAGWCRLEAAIDLICCQVLNG